jgi:hypothetical protein
MKFKLDEQAILNSNAIKALHPNVGDIVTIALVRGNPTFFDYDIRLQNGDIVFVDESELNELTDVQKELSNYIYSGNRIRYEPTNEKASIAKVDFLHNQAEIEFDEGGTLVVEFTRLRPLDEESESVGEIQKNTHEDLVNIFFNHYKNTEGTYTVPKELLLNLLNHIYEA